VACAEAPGHAADLKLEHTPVAGLVEAVSHALREFRAIPLTCRISSAPASRSASRFRSAMGQTIVVFPTLRTQLVARRVEALRSQTVPRHRFQSRNSASNRWMGRKQAD
jgi:hypothetical protein